jgi:hypothetical protein
MAKQLLPRITVRTTEMTPEEEAKYCEALEAFLREWVRHKLNQAAVASPTAANYPKYPPPEGPG